MAAMFLAGSKRLTDEKSNQVWDKVESSQIKPNQVE